jgi:hypothetical protein
VLKPEDLLYVRFEDLARKETRSKALRQITEFLTDDPIHDRHLESAFVHAEKFHRPPITNTELFISMEQAFTPLLLARFWNGFGCNSCGYVIC